MYSVLVVVIYQRNKKKWPWHGVYMHTYRQGQFQETQNFLFCSSAYQKPNIDQFFVPYFLAATMYPVQSTDDTKLALPIGKILIQSIGSISFRTVHLQ